MYAHTTCQLISKQIAYSKRAFVKKWVFVYSLLISFGPDKSPKFSKLANINDARASAYAYVDMRQVEAFLYMLSPMPLNFSC